jgi:hypothetical protein
MNFNTPNVPFSLPFWMMDISNYQLITSKIVPSDISDTKDIVLVEVPIPGLNFQPVMQGGGGNRKISFTLQLIKRNNTIGNLLMLKQFDMLRNQAKGLFSFFSDQFTSYPKVLFNWGIGSVPLIWYVVKADVTHRQGWVNQWGMPMVSEVNVELILDENNVLYKVEEVFRKLSAFVGMVTGLVDVIQSETKNERIY